MGPSFGHLVVVLSLLAGVPAASDGEKPTKYLLVLDKSGDSLSFIHPETYDTVGSVPTGRGPHEVEVSVDGKRAYVADYGGGAAPGNTITVVDLEKLEVSKTIDLGKHTRPHGLDVTADGKSLYVTCEGARALLRIALPEEEIAWAVSTDQDVSHMVAVTADGKKAYVANIGSGSVTIVDTEKQEVVKTLKLMAGTEGIDVSPDGSQVWLSNRSAGTVSVVDTEKDEVVETLKCGGFPLRVKFTPDGKRVLVSCAKAGVVAVFDAATRKGLARIDVGTVPIGLQPLPGSKKFFVACSGDPDNPAGGPTVARIDIDAKKVDSVFTAGKTPDGLALVPGKPPAEGKAAEKGGTPAGASKERPKKRKSY